MDAFFASVEQRDFPELRGRPIAVGGSEERGVVAAASYEARKFGVKSAMPSKTAKRLCPNLIFVRPRFEQYKIVSEQIKEIFLEYTPLVEPLSLDEAYLDVSENLKGISLATDIAIEIKDKIFKKTGLTASAGVSYNKFLAKVASDINKPNGIFIIKPAHAQLFIEQLPIKKFHGIGAVTASKMEKMGIYTGKDLKAKSLEFLLSAFGKVGSYYFEISRGEDHRVISPDRIRKSIGVENTFSVDLEEPDVLYRELDLILDQLWSRCQKAKATGKTLNLKIKFDDFEILSRSKTSKLELLDKMVVFKVAYELLNNLMPFNKGVRLIGLSLSNLVFLEELEGRQLTLDF